MNNFVFFQLVSTEKESEPDYDIPRPHTSLLTTLRIRTTRSDTIPATNFLCSTPIPEKDSLDSMLSRFVIYISFNENTTRGCRIKNFLNILFFHRHRKK